MNRWWPVLAAVLSLTVVTACREDASRAVAPDDAGIRMQAGDQQSVEASINKLITDLFPKPDTVRPHTLFAGIKSGLAEGDTGQARRAASDLMELAASTELEDPPGAQGFAELIDLLSEFVGLESPEIDPSLLADDGDDGTVALALDGEDNLILTEKEFAGTFIGDSALDEDLVVLIERITEEEQDGLPDGECLPTSLDQREGCYRFERYPEGTFQDSVRVGVCHAGIPDGFQLFRFSSPTEGLVPLPTVAFATLDCSEFASTLARVSDSPLPWRLVNAAWGETGGRVLSWLRPEKLYAVDAGFGGATLDFSRIGWARAMDVDIVEGDGQAASAGAQVATDPRVRVTHLPEEDDGHPIDSVEVTFTVVSGEGSVSSSTVITDSLGESSTSWTLGAGGTNELEASVPGDTVLFTATAGGAAIAFQSDRDGNSEIYVMNADGSGQTNLTNNSAFENWPNWSPDGAQIAFRSQRDGNAEVYVMNADGTGQTNLTSAPSFDIEPTWSPDGTKIAFRTTRDGNSEIYVMNADGSGQTNVTGNASPDIRLDWSPDGTKIAFRSQRDGNSDIFVVDADGSGQTRLTSDPNGDDMPAWSPDGTKIAFVSGRDDNAEIYVMNADSTGLTRLTSDPSEDDMPTWSPDGTKIAFVSDRDGNAEIYVMDADGSGVTNLTNDPASDAQPVWSPDGSRIAFVSTRDGNSEIYVMNADGSGAVNLTDDPAEDTRPVWRP